MKKRSKKPMPPPAKEFGGMENAFNLVSEKTDDGERTAAEERKKIEDAVVAMMAQVMFDDYIKSQYVIIDGEPKLKKKHEPRTESN